MKSPTKICHEKRCSSKRYLNVKLISEISKNKWRKNKCNTNIYVFAIFKSMYKYVFLMICKKIVENIHISGDTHMQHRYVYTYKWHNIDYARNVF